MENNILNLVQESIHAQHMSKRTENAYLDWIYRFISFHAKKDPATLCEQDINAFLSYLDTDCQKSLSTQNQALSALIFLYQQVLNMPFPSMIKYRKIKLEDRLPLILSHQEIMQLLAKMKGPELLMASLLYGSGLRVMEVVRLRIKDINLNKNQIYIWQPFSGTYRYSILPASLKARVAEQMYKVTALHHQSIQEGNGQVQLPESIQYTAPQHAKEIDWQFLFPAARLIESPLSGKKELRTHIHESILQKAVREAVLAAELNPKVSCHTLRHSFAVHVLQNGYQLKALKELLGHQDIHTTMLYSRIMKTHKETLQSPLDMA